MAGLRPSLVTDKLLEEGYTVMPGHYGMVEQATGIPKAKGEEAFQWLQEWIEEVKVSASYVDRNHHFSMEDRDVFIRKSSSSSQVPPPPPLPGLNCQGCVYKEIACGCSATALSSRS